MIKENIRIINKKNMCIKSVFKYVKVYNIQSVPIRFTQCDIMLFTIILWFQFSCHRYPVYKCKNF